jgi:hypothetical protein
VSLHFVRSRPTSLRDSVGVDFVRSLDLSLAPVSPLAKPSWCLPHRQIEVGGPLGVFVIVVFTSANLPAAPSTPSSDH